MRNAAPLTSPSRDLLGQRLLREGIITQEHLARALAIQKKSGGRIGEILYSLGACNSLVLHQQLAMQQGLIFADLLRHPPDVALLQEGNLASYLHLQALPWKKENGGVVIATPQITASIREWAARYYPHHCFALTSRLDINRSLALLFPEALNRLSRERLWRMAPIQSARETLQWRQRWVLTSILFLLAVLFALAPATTLVMVLLVTNGFYLTTLGFKTLLFVQGMKHRERLWKMPSLSGSDSELPLYTIFIPLYREAESLPQILRCIRALDYPHDRLDVKLVLESDDHETIAAAKALQPEGIFEILAVPPSEPRTKPKACNYALRFARGEYVTIYDAEDQPDPQQLRRVVQRFRTAGEDVVCVQCRLNYYNREHNLLTRLFAIEYAGWFDYMLPGLEALRLPIPLGGTSNHIALSKLIEMGEWDPYNVTEDADLGVRMAVARYRTVTLDSLTTEEAPITLWAWMKQRSRWVKGYMQTWLVHMRRPVYLHRKLGAKSFWGFQFFIGGPCLVFLSTPPLLLLSGLWLLGIGTTEHPLLPAATLLSIAAFIYGVVLHLAFARQVLKDTGWKLMWRAAATFPFYWILHSLASFRGLWQLITRPHYWDKTSHGHTPAAIAASDCLSVAIPSPVAPPSNARK